MHRQWMVALHDLPEAGRAWDAEVPKRLLEDRGAGTVDAVENLCDNVHWQVQLVRKGDVYRLTGNWQADIQRQCSRCNASFCWHEEGPTERDFRRSDHVSDEDDESGFCELVSPPGIVDLIDVLREDMWLDRKPDVICSENCKGLCARCGHDLSRGECDCDRDESDHPFAILRQMKLDA